MPRKKEYSRQESFLFATSQEDMIAPGNPVRVVEAFVARSTWESSDFI